MDPLRDLWGDTGGGDGKDGGDGVAVKGKNLASFAEGKCSFAQVVSSPSSGDSRSSKGATKKGRSKRMSKEL